MVTSILVRIIQRYLGPVEATHKNSRNKYQDWVKLHSTVPSYRARALLGLMPWFWVRFLDLVKNKNSCFMVARYIMIFEVLGK